MRAIAGMLARTLAISAGFSGCATAQEHPRTAVGAAVGAAGGALTGDFIGRDTTGVMVGG